LKGPWFQGNRENSLLDPPHREWFEGVLRRRPVLCREGVEEEFKSLLDSRKQTDSSAGVEAWVSFMEEKVKILPHQIKSLDLGSSHPARGERLRCPPFF